MPRTFNDQYYKHVKCTDLCLAHSKCFRSVRNHYYQSLLPLSLPEQGYVTTLKPNWSSGDSDISSAHFAVGIRLETSVRELHNLSSTLQMCAMVMIISQMCGPSHRGHICEEQTSGGLAYHHLNLCRPFPSCSSSFPHTAPSPTQGRLASSSVGARRITFFCSLSSVEIPSLCNFHHVRVALRIH